MSAPRWYGVISPEYNTGGGDYYDPPEYGRDWLPVHTTSSRRAIRLAVRTWRRRERLPIGHRAREKHHYCTADQAYRPPFCGLKAEPLGTCQHGVIVSLQQCRECDSL